ncbi:MAG TPA: hypothetical protein VIF32_02230 [Gemmatimonadaceae bacterium]|jgi:uncharacterized protein YcbK (DUF882 family)
MKAKFVIRALLGGSAAIVVSNAGGAFSAKAILSSSVAIAHARFADSDSMTSGRSGKLRGPLFSYLTRRPFTEKVNGRIGQYLIGFWPGERGRITSVAYQNPGGFIEVTQENQNTQVSEHFRLRDFLTHDQLRTWPKYVVLREELIDKLELVIQQLEKQGVVVRRMTVMSGFRTPQYNGPGGDGRSGVSRHMYGDAADVFVDNDGDGRMDDLNHDGRVDQRDARVIMDAAERVERLHPEFTGGVGVYRATDSHGPFAHVDVRGWRARWGLIG